MAIWHTKHAAIIAASDRWAILLPKKLQSVISYSCHCTPPFSIYSIPHPQHSPIQYLLTLPFHISSPSHSTSPTLPFHISSPSHSTSPHPPIPHLLTLPFHTPHPPIPHLLALPFSISLDQAKDVHRSLKVAAGMFLHVKDSLLPKLPASTEKGTDFDPRVVEAYANQSQAEAQEG